MNIQSFLRSAFSESMSIMGAEEIHIVGTKVMAVIDETGSSNQLGIGASQNERTLTAQFPAGTYSGTLKSGMKVEARDMQWQISSEPDSIRKGQSAITIVLVEPERRAE